ncbi:uncharacterized protein KQ657_000789 [Scheffersomyces spartinae]|uniref:Gfd2/YDR514C-like C-terminal domain-containing protein n=1 Tax=Scheffersomyces spartinae TaxID=45513 RepID=A0A9P7V8R8_9ASCO|nr:uncharacterized protein KQ657_000789 [Scheffersomyces spartinae]KAG7193371.1 hypothetical protein KQ657_000789 [Scheffersomyces spartinae]
MNGNKALLIDFEKFQELEKNRPSPYTEYFDDELSDYYNSIDYAKNKYLRGLLRSLPLFAAMERVYTRRNILFCIDVEAWEHDTKLVTELGVSIYDPRGQGLSIAPNITTYHIIIDEFSGKRNGRFVPNHLEYFNGGITYQMPQMEAVEFVQALIDYYFMSREHFGCCLVGHDVKGDSNWFRSIGIKLPYELTIIDTHTIYSLSHGRQGGSLKNLLKLVQVPNAFLHNAANDAYYTLLVAMKLCDPHVRTRLLLDQGRPLIPNKTVPQNHSKKHKLRNANKSDLVNYSSCEELLYDLYQSPIFEDSGDAE